MSRTRLIRPAFLKHAELFDAELASGLPLRLAYAGLWTVCDKEGRFAWKPRDIKADVLPHDTVDFAAILDALHDAGFIVRYRVDGKDFGCIPSWKKHQCPHKTERPSTLPSPLDNGAITVSPRVNAVAVTVRDTGTNYSAVAAKSAAPPERFGGCWQAIREHFYVPDGTPPADYDARRDASILAQLEKHHTPAVIETAIVGLALLRDYPGKYGDEITWVRANEKLTLRALYHTRSGVRPVFGLACDAYWKREGVRDRESTGKRTPTSLGQILGATQ